MEKINTGEHRRIIYYLPVPLRDNAASASGIRPLKMLNAFRKAGYTVDLVVGHSRDRKQAFAKIRRNVRQGVRYAFVYGESSTMPSELTDPGHFPLRPLVDFRFLRFCHRRDIPVGFFYRDIYWRFQEYKSKVPWLKRQAALLFYRFDLFQYRLYLKTLFLPSVKMADLIPGTLRDGFCLPLPPAHNEPVLREKSFSESLDLFYVGGVGNYYRLHKLIEVIREETECNLSICTREKEWADAKHEFGDGTLPPNIKIIHTSGSGLEPFFRRSKLAVLFIEPVPYWTITVPYKLFEYLGWGLPVIGSRGTLAGDIIEDLDIGWCIEYSEEALRNLIRELLEHPEIIDAKRANILAIRRNHTWLARVSEVEKALSAR